MDEVSEAQLWQRSIAGDGGAFAAIFDLHQSRLLRAAFRFSHTTTDAEDLVASTFLELWRRRRSVRVVDGSVLPWLLVTLSNLGRNSRRASTRHRRFLSRLPQPSSPAVALDQIEQLVAEREAMALLRGLSSRDAAILALTAFEGLSAAEAGIALGISAESARARLSRARQRAQLHLTKTLATEGNQQ